jgi:hypothetical protein
VNEQLLQTFFGAGNGIGLAKLRADPILKAFVPFADRLTEDPSRSTVLPRSSPQGSFLYAVPFSNADAAQLGEDLRSFFGETFLAMAQFFKTTTDPIEQALLEATEGRCWRHPIPGRDYRQELADQVWAMHWVWHYRQDECRSRLGPADLYRAFRVALLSGDRREAELTLREIKRSRQLDASNTLFLSIELLAAFEDDLTLLNAEPVEEALRGKMPSAVAAVIAAAAYRRRLSTNEAAGDAAALLEAARAEDFERYRPALATVRDPRDPDAAMAGVVEASLVENPDSASYLLDRLGPRRAFAERFLGLIKQVESVETIDPTELYTHGEYYKCFARLVSTEPGTGRTALLIRCTARTENHEMAAFAVAALQDHTHEQIRAFYDDPVMAPDMDAVYGPLEIAESGGPPMGWTEAFNQIGICDKPVELLRLIRGAHEQWSLAELAADHQAIEKLASAIVANYPPGRAGEIFDLKLLLIPWLLADNEVRAAMYPVFRALVEDLCSTSLSDAYQLQLITDLLPGALTTSPKSGGPQGYAAMLENLAGALEEVASLDNIDWVLDTLEVVARITVSDRAAAGDLFDRVGCLLHKFAEPVHSPRWRLLYSIAKTLGVVDRAENQIPEVAPAEATVAAAPFAAIDGKYVAIYTLMKDAGERAQAVLKEMSQVKKVRLYCETHATDSLRDAARNADLFVACINAAQHAATNAISEERGDRPLLKPRGKGSTAIVQVVREYCREQSA